MRIQSVDVLKGVAILGILFLNIYSHALMEIGYSPFSEPPLSDQVINYFSIYFLEGRFVGLFSLLFGVGLLIQYQSLCTQKLDAHAVIKSRLTWLFWLGVVHGCFIFFGDILLTYAVCALFIKHHLDDSANELFKRSARYLAIGFIISLVFSFLPDDTPERYSEEFIAYYTTMHSSYIEQLLTQTLYTAISLLTIPISALWCIAGVMLLGMALYKSQFFQQGLPTHFLLLCVIVMVLLSSLDGYLRSLGMSGRNLSIFSGLAGALIYAHCVILLCNRRENLLSWLIPVGKLSLSLYLFQSIVFAFIFRVWEQTWALDFTRLDYLYWVMGFTVLQVGLAHGHRYFFVQGPAEWLWRKLYMNAPNKTEKAG